MTKKGLPQLGLRIIVSPAPRVDNAGMVPQDDDKDAKARGLEALNQMHKEIKEKRHRVEAHQR